MRPSDLVAAEMARLRNEVAELKEELRHRQEEDGSSRRGFEEWKLTRLPGMTPHRARFILALYHAYPLPRSNAALSETVHGIDCDSSFDSIKVQIHHARKILGYDTIETVWGHGYRMTAKGREVVAAALQAEAA